MRMVRGRCAYDDRRRAGKSGRQCVALPEKTPVAQWHLPPGRRLAAFLRTETIGGAFLVAAAVGGMAAPALIYALMTLRIPGAETGWAIPTATDIAFALAILALVGRHLPGTLRTLLLTLAVVDDLLAILIIAIFYSERISPVPLAGSFVALTLFAIVVRNTGIAGPLRGVLAALLAATAWLLMLNSGVHATISAVLLGLVIPVLGRRQRGMPTRRQEATALREHAPTIGRSLDRALLPISAGLTVPLFALFAAGVELPVGGPGAATNRVTMAITAGLVLGKLLGISVTATIVGRWLKVPLSRQIRTADLVGIALLGGVGFTVALLIGRLAFSGVPERIAEAQMGVLTGSLISVIAAGKVLGLRSRHYRRVRRSMAAET